MLSLPKVETVYDLSSLQKNLAAFEPALRHIFAQHGLANPRLSLMSGGSMVLFAVDDDLVLKLFPEICRSVYETEVAALRELNGRMTIRTPQLKFAGSFDGWHYLVMTRVSGVELSTLWKTMDEAKKVIVCENLGRATAELHRLPSASAPATAIWQEFIEQQSLHCAERQRGHGLRAELVAQIPDYIRPALDFIKAAPLVFLHTEIMPVHVFIDPTRLTIESLIDFEPSMKGAAEYDFGAVAIFVAEGKPDLIRAFTRGYGYQPGRLPVPLSRLMMTYLLLHRYSRLPWYLDLLEGERAAQVTDLYTLAEKWWPDMGP